MPHFGELLIETIRAMVRVVIGEEMPGIQPPEHQEDATLTQANPVSGTKYTVLDTILNARIISISLQCTWTVQPSPLELWVTIDGISLMGNKTDPATATDYFAKLTENLNTIFLSREAAIHNRAFLIEGRSIKIEVEITGGTVQELKARVKYAKW